MPTIISEDGFQIRIYPADHEPPHVHVFKGGTEVKISIKNQVNILNPKTMKASDIKKALEIVQKHLSLLLAKWEEING